MEQQFQHQETSAQSAMKPLPHFEGAAGTQPLEAEIVQERAAVDALLVQLQQEAARRKRRMRWIVAGVVLYIGLMVGFSLLMWWATGKPQFGTLGSLGGMSGMIVAATAATQKQKEATKAIAQFNDPRAVGPLAEALTFSDRSVQEIAEAALIRLLPRLQATDSSLLNDEQRKCLYQVLAGRSTSGRNVDLVLTVLKAFEQVGDEQAIPAVEKLAAGGSKGARDSRVHRAAQECLQYLQQRAEQKRASQTLLRASLAETPPDTLLRPASGSLESDPMQLLRADQSDEQAKG